MKDGRKTLKQNKALALFPEGTRNGLAKGVKPKSGSILIAAKAGVPIIPCGVKGTCTPFTKVTLNYGKPIFYDKDLDLSDKETLQRLTVELMDEIVRLSKI